MCRVLPILSLSGNLRSRSTRNLFRQEIIYNSAHKSRSLPAPARERSATQRVREWERERERGAQQLARGRNNRYKQNENSQKRRGGWSCSADAIKRVTFFPVSSISPSLYLSLSSSFSLFIPFFRSFSCLLSFLLFFFIRSVFVRRWNVRCFTRNELSRR